MSHTAFFYGTLMAPPVLHRVIWGSQSPPTPAHASLLQIRPAILHAHRRHKVKGADYPAILPVSASTSPSSSVRGTLVEGLTDGDIWRLDIFEGSEYQRRKVKVKVLQDNSKKGDAENEEEGMGDLSQTEQDNIEGEEVEAETYIWTAGSYRLEPKEWDFAEFVRDKMKRWVGREAAETDEGFQGRPSIIGIPSSVEGKTCSVLIYIADVDDAVAEQQDPTGGRGVNGGISRQLVEGGKRVDEVLKSAV
jgi:hypothetical protein